MDTYERKARLYPAVCAVAPLTVLALALVSLPNGWGSLASLLAAGGVHVWVAQIVRDRGAARQPALWKSWGGSPTVAGLRWTTDQSDVLRLQRRIDVESVTGIDLPSVEQERLDPATANQVYDAAVARLRDLTRNETDFPLLKAENANYGFRRNLYGLRSIGMTIATTCLGIEATLGYVTLRKVLDLSLPALVVAVVAASLALVAWLAVVNPEFVRRSADRYASALFGAAVVLATRAGPQPHEPHAR